MIRWHNDDCYDWFGLGWEKLGKKKCVSFKREKKKDFALFLCNCLSFVSLFSFGKSKPGAGYQDWCLRMVTYVKNHTAAAPLDGRCPSILGKYEIRVEHSINSSDLVWVFQLCGEKNPLF